ncbi:membrane-anchored junction protein [Pleurodeles waltl]|uniref:membrane-anchored junction protein n=1 Tax=Pleurodeles waltl TaxID=8319 RepID=UPI003709877E
MPLKPFTYPLPETRFLHAGTSVYKFKIKYGSSINVEDVENKESIVKELEEAVRVIIANLHDLQPFATRNLIIFPYKSKWESVSKLRFKHGDAFLSPFPYICTMYVESNSFQQNFCLVLKYFIKAHFLDVDPFLDSIVQHIEFPLSLLSGSNSAGY